MSSHLLVFYFQNFLMGFLCLEIETRFFAFLAIVLEQFEELNHIMIDWVASWEWVVRMEVDLQFCLMQEGQELVEGDMSFYIKDYLRYCLLTDSIDLTCRLDQSQSFRQADAPLLVTVDLVELLKKALHLHLDVTHLLRSWHIETPIKLLPE